MYGSINFEAIPGTTHLVDLDGHMNAQHSKNNSQIVLIPTPSEDPDDPLNWSTRRKWLAAFCNVVYTFGVGVPSAAIYSIVTNIATETGITVGELTTGTGYFFLFAGLGNLIFQPLALQYGKRPIYLLSMLAVTLICVWAPYSKSNAEWIGGKILQGFFSAPIEALCEITMSDIFFEHDRAKGMGIYAVALSASNYLAPMVAGFISDGIGWKWVMWMCAVFGAVCFVFMFIFMEETNYNRKLNPEKSDDMIIEGVSKDGELNTRAIKVGDEQDYGKEIDRVLSHQTMEERMQETNENLYNEGDVNSSYDGYEPKPRKNFIDKLSLTGGFKDRFLLRHYFLGPFKMARFPSVLFAGFLYGSSLIWFNLLNATEASVLGAPPYNFSSAMCGVAYISPTIFCVLFFFLAGTLSDFLKIRIAKSRNGLSIPEDRLWVMLFYMVLGFLSSIGWGVGAYYGAHWMVLVISMGVLGGLIVVGCTCAVTYCSDTYHEMDTEAMVVVIVIRNVMSFACSYGLNDWVDNMGYKHAFISSSCILFFCSGTFLIMRATGPYWRNKTKKVYWTYVEHNRKVINGDL